MSGAPEVAPKGAPIPTPTLIPIQDPGSAPYERAPGAAHWLQWLLRPVDRVLDRVYGSAWNPLYHSGTLALALLVLVTATGVYLLLFYRIGAPYESIVRLQEQVLAGRWVRAFHRYASDLAVLLVGFHALRMMVEGRTWGPRVLAWISGLVLLGAVLVCGWTGYVLVWDAHGLLLGAAGARLFDALPFFSSPISRSFSGAAPFGESFFYLNLFLHMCVPLGMALLLWIHTSRLARSRWWPGKQLLWTVAGAIVALSVALPAPLDAPADPLRLSGRTTLDLFFSAWVPLIDLLTPIGFWAMLLAVGAGLFFLPLWWRPSRAMRPGISRHNPAQCTGCTQCTQDCPFEAVSMVPRTEGKGSEEIAAVDPARCVSCGICAGSCEQLAIGPSVRSGHAQIRLVKKSEAETLPEAIAFVTCRQSDVEPQLLPQLVAGSSPVVYFVADCVGSLHSLTVARLASHYQGVFLLACPTRRCTAREGVFTAAGRFFEGRDPAPPEGLDATRIRLVAGARAERVEIRDEFGDFKEGLGERRVPGLQVAGRRRGATKVAIATVVTGFLLAGIAGLSSVPWGAATSDSALRLAWRLPGQSYEDCRPLSEEEIAALPQHMRRTEDCVRIYLEYQLVVWVDGDRVLEERVLPLGARGDRPLYVEKDLSLATGQHDLRIDFEPVADPSGKGARLYFEGAIEADANRAVLVTVGGKPLQFQIGSP